MAILRVVLLILLLVPVGCMSPRPLNWDDPMVRDAREYARDQGVPLAEAVNRLEWQEAIGELGARLAEQESATFGELWIQHEPAYRVVLAFTENGEATLWPYIAGQPYAHLVEVRQVKHTLSELQASQVELRATLGRIGIQASSGISVQTNRVELSIGNPTGRLRTAAQLAAELAAAGLELPEAVTVVETGGPGAANRPSVETVRTPDGQEIYFPKQAAGGLYMAALAQGILVEENGCLRLASLHGGESHLIIWRDDQTLRVNAGAIEVFNGEGKVSGRVGQPIGLGGGEMPTVSGSLQMPACPGPYWIAGEDAEPPPVTVADAILVPLEPPFYLLTQGPAVRRWALPRSTVSGEFLLEERCLRLKTGESGDYLLVFPPGVAVSAEERLFAIVAPARTGGGWQMWARIGETVTLAGSPVDPETLPTEHAQLAKALPGALLVGNCPRPWVISLSILHTQRLPDLHEHPRLSTGNSQADVEARRMHAVGTIPGAIILLLALMGVLRPLDWRLPRRPCSGSTPSSVALNLTAEQEL